MDSPPPAPWTFAARAAYFGDRLCAFCEHRNPAGANFCNDCGSPLHLKPCNQCAAVNDQAATCCYQCGAEGAALFTRPEPPLLLTVADAAAVPRAPGDIGASVTAAQPAVARADPRAHSRLLRPGYLAAFAMILMMGAYAAFRTESAGPDALGVASEPVAASNPPGVAWEAITASNPPGVASEPVASSNPPEVASEAVAVGIPSRVAAEPTAPGKELGAPTAPAFLDKQTAPTTVAAAPVMEEPEPAGPGGTVAPHPPNRTRKLPAMKHASAHQRPVLAPVTKRASAPQWRARVAANPRIVRTIAATHVRTRIAETRKARQTDWWQPMHVSLTQCGNGLLTRIVCDQRVRRRFCEGRWGASPECASGITNDRGQ